MKDEVTWSSQLSKNENIFLEYYNWEYLFGKQTVAYMSSDVIKIS